MILGLGPERLYEVKALAISHVNPGTILASQTQTGVRPRMRSEFSFIGSDPNKPKVILG